MNQLNNNDINEIQANHPNSPELNINANASINDDLLKNFYSEDSISPVMIAALDYMDACVKHGLTLPYFADISLDLWQQKPKALDIYITDSAEGRELNLEARGKDYATNILSYPSEMPASIIELMPTLPLGELIICHEVVLREAAEQDKTVAQHINHLIVHGMLHLLGFDHEIGQMEQDEMERFEIDILAGLALPNPYL